VSATEPGEYRVTIVRPTGDEYTWIGYADNRTDALYRTMTLVEEEVDPG